GAGDVDEDAAGDDGRDGGRVALARPPVAAPVLLLEAVVPVIVVALGCVAQAVDLGRDVVVDEERAAVPRRAGGVVLDDPGNVLLPLHPFGRAERDDLAGAVAGPLVGG